MYILGFELRRNLRTFLIWVVAISAFVAYMMSVYQSSFAGAGSGVEQFLTMFPESFKKAFGIDRLDLTTAIGYFGMEVHLMIILFGAMYATLTSSSLLSKEENDKTIEFLLSRPVTRAEVVTQKLLVFVIYAALFTAITWLAAYASLLIYGSGDENLRPFWMLGGMTFLAILAVSAVGFLVSVFLTRNRTVYSAALGLVLALYALQIVADVSDRMKFLSYLTPFKWASAADILPRGEVNLAYLLIAISVITLALAGSYVAYGRKDIRA